MQENKALYKGTSPLFSELLRDEYRVPTFSLKKEMNGTATLHMTLNFALLTRLLKAVCLGTKPYCLGQF